MSYEKSDKSKSISYSEYVAERIDRSIDYSEYIAKNALDKKIEKLDYNPYLPKVEIKEDDDSQFEDGFENEE